MAAVLKFVTTRGGVFQYVRRVPVSVTRNPTAHRILFGSQALVRRSFGTKNQSEMTAAYSAIHDDFEARVAQALGRAPLAPVDRAMSSRKLTDADLDSIADRYAYLTAEPFEKLHRLASVNPVAAAELDRMESDLEMDATEICEAVRTRGTVNDAFVVPPAQEASFVAKDAGFLASPGSAEMGMIANAVRAGMERGYKRVAELSASTVFPSMPKQSSVVSAKAGLTIEEAANRYLTHKKLPAKTVSEVRLALRLFMEVVGNKTLETITREDCRTYLEHLSMQQIGGKTAGSVQRSIAPGTVKKRIGFITSIINHSLDRGWFDGTNPASNIRLSSFVQKSDVAVMPIKRRLKVDEINKILQHPWFTGCRSSAEPHLPGNHRLAGSEYWAVVVALFTGCRAGELGGLRIAEVQLDVPHPHLIIQNNEYRRTKGGYARNVPILDALIDIGFADYVDRIRRSGADRLFPDWTARKARTASDGDFPAWSNAAVIRAFNRTVIPAALGDTLRQGARREVTFHSLRGAFKSMLGTNHNVPTNIVHEIVGHAKSELDSRYVGTIEIEATYPVVRGCNYARLVLPPPPSS